MTTVLAGMFTPSASVSVANTARTRPAANSFSTTSLKAGSIPAWCAVIPRRSPVTQSWYPRTARSSSGMSAVRCAATDSIKDASSGVVSRSPAARHCWTASSQPARLKMNVIAGSSPAASSRSMVSGRYGGAGRRDR